MMDDSNTYCKVKTVARMRQVKGVGNQCFMVPLLGCKLNQVMGPEDRMNSISNQLWDLGGILFGASSICKTVMTWLSIHMCSTFDKYREPYLSLPRMKTLGLTAMYFPLPQPTSKPTEPVGSSVRNFSTIGHGYRNN